MVEVDYLQTIFYTHQLLNVVREVSLLVGFLPTLLGILQYSLEAQVKTQRLMVQALVAWVMVLVVMAVGVG